MANNKTTLEQWRMFKAVVDAGGFNQASLLVHKSQSSIHTAVGKLEDALGIKLFEVEGRKAHLTEPGRLMLRRGEFLLDEVARIEAVAESLCSGVESQLSIAVDGAFPQCILFSALEQVSSIYPQVKIDIIDTVLSGANELIESGTANIALSPIPLSKGLNEELCQIEFVAVAHVNHPLNQVGRELSFEDLKSCRQIIVRDSATHNKRDAGWQGAEQRWTVSHVKASIELICQSLGYAWLPLPEINKFLETKLIKKLDLQEGATRTASFYLNYQDKDQLGPAARELMGHLRLLTLEMPTSDDL